jgi:hypothetical protein
VRGVAAGSNALKILKVLKVLNFWGTGWSNIFKFTGVDPHRLTTLISRPATHFVGTRSVEDRRGGTHEWGRLTRHAMAHRMTVR